MPRGFHWFVRFVHTSRVISEEFKEAKPYKQPLEKQDIMNISITLLFDELCILPAPLDYYENIDKLTWKWLLIYYGSTNLVRDQEWII